MGIIADADEVFTRDFLKALQICNIPQFEHGQSCDAPKLLGSTLVFESSPECIATGDHVATKIRRWHHPGEWDRVCEKHSLFLFINVYYDFKMKMLSSENV